MAKFRYSLQNILDIKLKMETQAKQEFAAAAAALSAEEEKLDLLKLKKESLENKAATLLTGPLNFRDIDDNSLERTQTDQAIADQKKQIKKAQAVLETCRKKMEEAMTERKTYEKLRERAFEEYMLEEKRAESKAIDELTSYTYGQKAKG